LYKERTFSRIDQPAAAIAQGGGFHLGKKNNHRRKRPEPKKKMVLFRALNGWPRGKKKI